MKTWSDIFMPRNNIKKGSTYSLEIKDNGATIVWRPRFAIYEYCETGNKLMLSPKDAGFSDCVEASLAGVLRWDSDAFPNQAPIINDIKGHIAVNIYDANGRLYIPQSKACGYNFAANSYRDSNVAIVFGKKDKAIVWDAFFWRRHKRLRIKIGIRRKDKDFSHGLSRTIEHEFGHVLGLFDAYGYAKKNDPEDGRYHYGGHRWPNFALPPAPIDGTMLLRNSVMVCNYCAFGNDSEVCSNNNNNTRNCLFTRTSLDYEMILRAWRDNRLQLYSDSILGKRSNAFRG